MNLNILYCIYFLIAAIKNILKVTPCDWRFDNIGINTTRGDLISMAEYLSNKNFDFVINAPMMVSGANRVASFITPGYRMRRLAVEHSVPLVTDVKCAKLLIEVLYLLFFIFLLLLFCNNRFNIILHI